MIDVTKEAAISFNAARKFPELQRDGKRPDIATIYRWASRGVRGVRLEAVQIGGTRCTSHEAVKRFLQKLTEENAPASEAEPVADTEQAEAELQAAGF